MNRRTYLGILGGGALLGGGYLGIELFAPERATRVDEDRTGEGDGATVLTRWKFCYPSGA